MELLSRAQQLQYDKSQQLQGDNGELLDTVSEPFELVWLSSLSAMESMDDGRIEGGDDSHVRIWKVAKAYFALARSVPLSHHCHAWLGHLNRALQRTTSAHWQAAEHASVREVLDVYLAKAKASWGDVLDKALGEYPDVKTYMADAYPELSISVQHRLLFLPSAS
jgi:hypothetical protein